MLGIEFEACIMYMYNIYIYIGSITLTFLLECLHLQRDVCIYSINVIWDVHVYTMHTSVHVYT